MRGVYQTTAFCLRGFFRLFYHLSIYGRESAFPGKAILAPNHASFLDPPLIGAACSEEIHFLARASLFQHHPLGKRILSYFTAHPIQGTTQDIESFRIVCQLLSEEKKVVIFPEGERTATGQLQTIKSGIAMLALRMQCPIIPIYIKGTFEAWPKHSRWPKFGSSLACVFGRPIYPTYSKEMNKKQMQESIRQQVEKEWINLYHWFEAGAKGERP